MLACGQQIVGQSQTHKQQSSVNNLLVWSDAIHHPGVSMKIIILKYPAGLNRVTDCIKRGLLVPFLKGRGVWGCASPENFEISKP